MEQKLQGEVFALTIKCNSTGKMLALQANEKEAGNPKSHGEVCIWIWLFCHGERSEMLKARTIWRVKPISKLGDWFGPAQLRCTFIGFWLNPSLVPGCPAHQFPHHRVASVIGISRGNQFCRLSFMVAVEVLLSTLGPNFTCWVGASQKFNGVHHITLYRCTPHNRLWSVNSWQRLTCRSNDSSPSWTLNNLGFLLQQKMVLLPAIIRIMPVHAFLRRKRLHYFSNRAVLIWG